MAAIGVEIDRNSVASNVRLGLSAFSSVNRRD
jgi:hypothetical protein